MSIEDIHKIDIATIDHASGDLWLTITDHLPWLEHDGSHLEHLQSKLNAYLAFIESGELLEKIPSSHGRKIVINLVAKFPPSEGANRFLELASRAIEKVGCRLQLRVVHPN
jgi:hypothetical protein